MRKKAKDISRSFQENFERKLFIRRVIYPPQYHSMSFLKQISYEHLLSLFNEVRQSFRESGSFLVSDKELVLRLTIQSIWIEVMIEEEVLLAKLRQPNSPANSSRYHEEREAIINEHLAKIYIKYLPRGTVLNEQGRAKVVT